MTRRLKECKRCCPFYSHPFVRPTIVGLVMNVRRVPNDVRNGVCEVRCKVDFCGVTRPLWQVLGPDAREYCVVSTN